jgi:lipoprotein-anchoring transpeptidase ErfK/SrfK
VEQPNSSTEPNPEKNPTPSKHSSLGAWALGGIMAALATAFFVARHLLPFGIAVPDYLEGAASNATDPRKAISIEGIGLGTKLIKAELINENGQTLAEINNQSSFKPDVKLEFGRKYTLSATAERLWLNQKGSKEVTFTTVSIPKIESAPRQELAPDGSIQLRFSEPVGAVTSTSDLKLTAKPDEKRQTFALQADTTQINQGQTYNVDVNWETRTGVPLPPFRVEVSTAPPLTASIATAGMSNIGLAMPVQIDFSEALHERENVTDHIKVTTHDGRTMEGKWLWFGKQRLQFRPQPHWPAKSSINVRIDPAGMKSTHGGFLTHPVEASFNTGPDKRIEVFLDKQRVNVIENGEVVKTLKASTGKAGTPTVTGSFYIYARFPTKTMRSTGKKPGQPGYYEVKDVPYAQYFYEGYAFHGAFWHNNFGRPASHGCVNLATRKKNGRGGVNEDAGWLYQWASLGVPVTVHRSTPAQNKVATTQ